MDNSSPVRTVWSSRIRLARNISGAAFPSRQSEQDAQKIIAAVKDCVDDLIKKTQYPWDFIMMEDVPDVERHVLKEKHLISPEFARSGKGRALLVRDDGQVIIMINEEDHLRIQCVQRGLDLETAYREAQVVDEILEAKLDFAFRDDLGYLTACPTNVGTGLRASVMMHLPAINLYERMTKAVGALNMVGLVVRGMYGEGSNIFGDVYQISNQITMGLDERATIERLKSFVMQVAAQEELLRKNIIADRLLEFADKAWRSYGVLRYARSLDLHEAMRLISDVILGVDIGVIDCIEKSVLGEIIDGLGSASIVQAVGEELTQKERMVLRAERIRNQFTQNEGAEEHV